MMFCPTCAGPLQERALLDPHLQGYSCANDHFFYTTLVEPRGGIPLAHTARPAPSGEDIAVLKYWLTDADARERVPNQLAVVCRRIVEIVELDHHIAVVPENFLFCPTCTAPLTHFESDDLYMQGLRCNAGHEFWARGNYVIYTAGGVRTDLCADITDDYVLKLIPYYTGTERFIVPYVHEQIRDVLLRYLHRAGRST